MLPCEDKLLVCVCENAKGQDVGKCTIYYVWQYQQPVREDVSSAIYCLVGERELLTSVNVWLFFCDFVAQNMRDNDVPLGQWRVCKTRTLRQQKKKHIGRML